MRFSRRLAWSTQDNYLSQRLAELRRLGGSFLDLTSSNPTRVLSSYPHREIVSAYAALSDVSYQPEPAGIESARNAVAAYYARRGIRVSSDRILLTASSSEAYSLLFKLFCDGGDEVLVPRPSYPLFEYLAGLEAISPYPYLLRFDGAWFPDFDSLGQALARKPKALVIVHPNNPTGSFWHSNDLEELLRRSERSACPVISDEVFSDYDLGGDVSQHVRTLAQYPDRLSFSLNGLSKVAGMPQVKLGWIVLNGPDKQIQDIRKRLELILDTYLSVNTPVQAALSQLLLIGEKVQSALKHRIQKNYECLQDCLQGTPATVLLTEAGWSSLVRLPNLLTEDEWAISFLEQQSVVTQPGYFFDLPLPPTIVLSLITPEREFAEGVKRIKSEVLTIAQG